MLLAAHRSRVRDTLEIEITSAFMNEWFARQETISGKTLTDALGKKNEADRPKSEREIAASVGTWAQGDWEPLDTSDMVIQ